MKLASHRRRRGALVLGQLQIVVIVCDIRGTREAAYWEGITPLTACTIPLPTLMSFFLKDMPFTLPPEHVMVDPPAVVKVLPSDMSARVTAPWMTWCFTMSGSAWCDMRSILVVPSFWASSTKASSLGQKTVMGPALVRRPSQLVCVDRAGAMGCQFLHPPRSRRSEKRAASGCEQTRVDKGDPRVVASGATSIDAAMRRCRVHARGDIGVDPTTLSLLKDSLHEVTLTGTSAGVFANFPVQTSGKTGTAEVFGRNSDGTLKSDTSWYASYAPTKKPRYAVVMVVSQGGFGASISGLGVRNIYEALFGVQGGRVVPELALFPDGKPPTELPRISPTTKPRPSILNPGKVATPSMAPVEVQR